MEQARALMAQLDHHEFAYPRTTWDQKVLGKMKEQSRTDPFRLSISSSAAEATLPHPADRVLTA